MKKIAKAARSSDDKRAALTIFAAISRSCFDGQTAERHGAYDIRSWICRCVLSGERLDDEYGDFKLMQIFGIFFASLSSGFMDHPPLHSLTAV
ncbi:hypothetical protein [Paenibacillus favisporus]|uniref:hypothetical protein n=1 Tax=Paenibacillus favisporus TaxID=221028 RepID=UPI003D2CA00E